MQSPGMPPPGIPMGMPPPGMQSPGKPPPGMPMGLPISRPGYIGNMAVPPPGYRDMGVQRYGPAVGGHPAQPVAVHVPSQPDPTAPMRLARGWIRYWDPAKAEHYYYNESTNVTRWEKPDAAEMLESQQSQPQPRQPQPQHSWQVLQQQQQQQQHQQQQQQHHHHHHHQQQTWHAAAAAGAATQQWLPPQQPPPAALTADVVAAAEMAVTLAGFEQDLAALAIDETVILLTFPLPY